MGRANKTGVSLSLCSMALGTGLRQRYRQSKKDAVLISYFSWGQMRDRKVFDVNSIHCTDKKRLREMLTRKKKGSDSILIYFRLGAVFSFSSFFSFFSLSLTISLPEARSFSDTCPCYLVSHSFFFPRLQKPSKHPKDITVAKKMHTEGHLSGI